MSKLLCVAHSDFSNEMDKLFDKDEKITSLNVFDTFVKAISKVTNMLSEEKLKGLVFKQCKAYGDFDETMVEIAENISDIKESTQDALMAIDKQDVGGLKSAYEQLKNYQKRILQLEKDIYTDELTGAYNRKYLVNHELNKDGVFKVDGSLLHISINNFGLINKEYGHETGDSVLKLVSKMCQKDLKKVDIQLIRYKSVHFIAIVKESIASEASSLCQNTVNMILSKKFKSHNGDVLNIDLKFNEIKALQGQIFRETYEKL